jgi:hypothetical protein
MGAHHCTQIRYSDGEWYPVSQLVGAKRVSRRNGFEYYVIYADIPPEDVRAYHRSNSGAVTTTIRMMANGYTGEDIPVDWHPDVKEEKSE